MQKENIYKQVTQGGLRQSECGANNVLYQMALERFSNSLSVMDTVTPTLVNLLHWELKKNKNYIKFLETADAMTWLTDKVSLSMANRALHLAEFNLLNKLIVASHEIHFSKIYDGLIPLNFLSLDNFYNQTWEFKPSSLNENHVKNAVGSGLLSFVPLKEHPEGKPRAIVFVDEGITRHLTEGFLEFEKSRRYAVRPYEQEKNKMGGEDPYLPVIKAMDIATEELKDYGLTLSSMINPSTWSAN